MKNILLLGGGGFLGVNIAIALLQKEYHVFCMDRTCDSLRHEKCLVDASGFFEGDVANTQQILQIVDEKRIECVINLASSLIPSSGFQEFSAEMERCMLPAFALLPELARRSVRYAFFSSGGTVYGRPVPSAGLMSETDVCQPVNLYGYSKWVFEEYLGVCARMHALQYLILRPSNPYGPYQNPRRTQGFIAVAMHRLLRGEVIDIWGDGSVVRDYIFVTDMANAFVDILGRDAWGEVFNIGSGKGYSLLEVLAAMEEVSGKKARVEYKASRSVDVGRIVLAVDKLRSSIDFNPISLVDGLRLYHEGLVNATL